MSELIKVKTDPEGIQTVNARDLHEFLEVRRRFTTWIQERIKKYSFNEGLDFLPELGESVGGRPGKIYHISLDMAKELSMVENNEKGREARKYFIECERKLKNPVKTEIEKEVMILQALTFQQERIKELTIKAIVADELVNTDGLHLLSTVGKIITGEPNMFCQWLVDNNYMYRKGDHRTLVPKSPYDRREKGYFRVKLRMTDGETVTQTYFTSRGVCWIQALYLKKNGMLQLDYSKYLEA